MEDDVDINTLTLEKYLAWVQDDIRPRVVKPKIGNDVEFEINSKFMRELRRKLFKGTVNEDAHEHVRRVLEIVDLFHFLGVTHDAVMLRVFLTTLTRPALRWINRLTAGLVTTLDLLEKAFIRQYCPPFKTAKILEIIRNFKQEMDETLYHAWERYSDLLYRCPQHDLNSQQKVHIFYTGLDIFTRRILDSRGFIPLMTPTQALKSIQVMAEHSHDWYDKTTTRGRINDSSDNVDAIQASFKGAHLTKDCPLKKEDKEVEQSKNVGSLEETIIKFCDESIKKQAAEDEWIRKLIKNTKSNIRELKTTIKNLQEKAYQLTQIVLTNTCEKFKARTTMGKENVKEPVPQNLPVVQNYVPPMQFLGSPYRTHEAVCAIGIPVEIQEDEGDMNDGCDITVEVCYKIKVKREEELDYDIPLQEHVMQPLTPQAVHITPPDDNYVAPATNPILNKHLNEFREELTNNTRVLKKIDSNPVNDLKELLKTYDFETFIRELLHQLSQSSHETGNAKREMKSHQQNGFNLSFPYPVANLHPYGVHCYSHPHLISSEGRNTLLLGSHSKELEFEVFLTFLSCGKKVMFRRNHIGETRLFYRRSARIHLLQSSFKEKSNAQGSLLF
ncbi:reverse transcriptase domain-containing protein [Tanacetum coccineum]|uniref:Reverse transcriptase domain-containing protein n=1 Tax=Tanacetum coccineum TaxID=301880 RepID=A0ABQ4XU03_9ASTR